MQNRDRPDTPELAPVLAWNSHLMVFPVQWVPILGTVRWCPEPEDTAHYGKASHSFSIL